jgi:prepilin-type N-terminal cleavage/methylation domain-containing protein
MIDKKGFTLMELLVVIAIISIIMSIAIAGLSRFTTNSRDSKRIADLEYVAQSLEQFKNNNTNGLYPILYYNLNGLTGWDAIDKIQPSFFSYLKDKPQDPLPPTTCTNYLYSISADQLSYTLYTRLENTNFPQAKQIKPTPVAPAGGVYNQQTYSVNSGPCTGTTFNYWINNP